MSSIYDWSTTAANNGTADSDTPWPEGMARRQVNDSARNMMKRNAELLGDIGGALSAGGTANGLTVTANSAFTAYANGQVVSFRATADNTGAATLSVNAIGAKAIRKMDNTGDVALAANDIRINGIYVAQYSTALNGAAGAWLLVNPTLSAAIYALSGLTTTDNAVARFDSTAGKLQNSGVIIDDSNNLTIPGSIAQTDATPLITTVDTATGNKIWIMANAAGAYRIYEDSSAGGQDRFILSAGGALSLASNITTGGHFIAPSGGVFRGSTTQAILGSHSLSGDAATIYLRPDGYNSSTAQTTIDASGNMSVAGSITGTAISGTTGTFSGALSATTGTFSGNVTASGSGVFAGTATQVIVGSLNTSGDAATIYLRPDGYNSATAQTTIDPSGNMIVAGDITSLGTVSAVNFSASTGGFHTAGKTAANAATVGASVITSGQGLFTVISDACQIINRITSSGTMVQARFNNVTVGTLTTDGTGFSLTTSSDYRLKNNIRDLEGSGAFIDALRPRAFDWSKTGKAAFGFIAHEFAEVCPSAVVGEKDGDEFQQIDASSPEVIANIVAELKSLRARVAELES